MEVSHKTVGQVAVLNVIGDIDLFNTSGIQTIVKNFMDEKIFRIVLNLEYVNYIDSTGIGMLFSFIKTLKTGGGGLKLVKLSATVRRVFEMARIISNFEIFDSEENAIRSFGSGIGEVT